MTIKRLVLGPFEANCYIVSDDAANAVCIDPGYDIAEIIAALEPYNLCSIFLTHGHLDHISAVGALAQMFPDVPVYIAPADALWAFSDRALPLPPYKPVLSKPAALRETLTDGTIIEAGTMRFEVLSTPGHTPGSVCFYTKDDTSEVLFSGDTLFCGSIGRTDFPGGDNRAMFESLKRLATLPPATILFSGHGEQSNIAEERQYNPYLREFVR